MAEFNVATVIDSPPPDNEGLPILGPWHPAADFILCLLPIAFLVLVTLVKKLALPTAVSLPFSAVMMLFIRLAYLASPPNFCMATLLSGFLEVLTPLSIIFGAILLFQTMHHTKCLPWIMGQIKDLSGGHPVSEVFLISWAFAYLVEGASGFGTPVALASPMLASLGHDPFNTVVCGLIMNTLATQFGAVGTPVWYGFGELGLEQSMLQKTGFTASIIVAFNAYVIPIYASSFLLSLADIRQNIIFILLSISSCVVPAVCISLFSYEFPSIVGGLIGVLLTALLAKFKIGLSKKPSSTAEAKNKKLAEMRSSHDLAGALKTGKSTEYDLQRTRSYKEIITGLETTPYHPTLDFPITNDPRSDKNIKREALKEKLFPDYLELEKEKQARQEGSNHDIEATRGSPGTPTRAPGSPGKSAAIQQDLSVRNVIGRTLPIWLTILLLIITRIPQLRIKGILQMQKPGFTWRLGSLANFRLSASLVFQIQQILTETKVNWKYELLYVPFFIPFTVVSCVAIAMYFRDFDEGEPWWRPFADAASRVSGVVVSLTGALCLVQLIRNGGTSSPAYIIGFYMSKWLGKGFIAFAFPLGALGSFFSGSTTVSNLTFGEVNVVAARSAGVSISGMLGLQVAGSAAGNMVCLNNILSAQAVMGLSHINVGDFIKRTALPCVLFYVIATAFGLIFTLV